MRNFSKDDNDYLEPRLYQTCIWKRNRSSYQTKTNRTHFRAIGTNWLVIFSGLSTEDLIPEKGSEWPCRPALYSQCIAAFTQKCKITKLTTKHRLTPNMNEKMWQPQFKIHLVTKFHSRWEWVSQHYHLTYCLFFRKWCCMQCSDQFKLCLLAVSLNVSSSPY